MSSDQPEAVVESLRQERLHVQKKTFTKWANIHLQKFGLQINDLFQDMGDGLKLMRLLEALSGEKLGKPAKGTARINKIENVSRCLMFLHSKKMRLENISSEDIVDGKPHLILGLLWIIILRYEIPSTSTSTIIDTEIPKQEEAKVPAPKIAKDSLLLWCQTKTNGYPRVHVRDFHRSWRDGLAFNALIHSHVPSLVDFDSLKQEDHLYNLESAFSIAQKQIGVPRLMDPEDVDTDNPDEKSILVYVSTFCKGLGKYREEMTGGRRITNVITRKSESDNLKRNYIESATDLLEWIHSQVNEFNSKQKLESIEEIQKEIANFKSYRIEKKPKQSVKKNEIEVLYFTIQMQRLGQNGWMPPEDVSPAAIEKAWSVLQRAEHEHEINIRNQLKEQERLENLAYKFETKRTVREGYINDIQKILTDPSYGANIKQSDATFKKHEAIRTGILAREIMIQDLVKIAEVLIDSNYRKKDDIIVWKKNTEEKWQYLLRLLEAFDEKFSYLREVISTLEEMDSILEEMQNLQAELNTETEPLDISLSLKQHDLKEVQIASWAEAVSRFERKVAKQEKDKDTNILQTQVKKLRKTHDSLIVASRMHRQMLEKQLKMKEHNENVEQLLAWLFEKQLYCTSDVHCKDLACALLLQKKLKALKSELVSKNDLIENMGEERLKVAILELQDKLSEKEELIDLAVEAFQYIWDADECSSWISENMHLLSTLDYGTDELTSEALLRRHVHTEEKIVAYSVEIKDLRENAEKLCNSLQKTTEDNKTRKSFSETFSANDFFRNCDLYSSNISARQQEIEKSYSDLQTNSQRRKAILQQSSMYFSFKERCDEIEKWMREKEKTIDTNDFGSQNDEMEKRFEEFLTDMIAHGLIIDELALMVDRLEEGNAKQAKTARMLLDDIQRRWQHLNQLTRLKEQNLKGHTSLLLAHRTCETTISFLNERLISENIETLETVTSFDELRRRQEAIQREQAVAEDRVKQALVLAENVSSAYPDQNDPLQTRMEVLDDSWKKYKEKMKHRQQKLEKGANVQIFKAKANYLINWLNDIQTKLTAREKISDLEIAQNIAKDHKEIREEMDMQDYKFTEIQELGSVAIHEHPGIEPILKQIAESKEAVLELWDEKRVWITENLDLQIFDREANHLQSICTNQNTLLDAAEKGETLSDVEILIRHHDSFVDTFEAQTSRFSAFNEMADKLLNSDRENTEYIRAKQEEISKLRESVLQKANERSLRLQQDYYLQEFKVDAQEMITWIEEKNKRALDLWESDKTTRMSSKVKRLETLEAELYANQNRLQNVYMKGQKLAEECNFAKSDIECTLEEIENAWNLLCQRLDLNRQSLQSVDDFDDFIVTAEVVEKKLNEIKKMSESTWSESEKRTVQNLLQKQEIMEKDFEKVKEKVSRLIKQGQKLKEESDCDQTNVQSMILKIDEKLKTTEEPLASRREKLDTCMKFHQFRSEVERELLWISDQIILLSADTPCKSLLEAQKLQKKLENLEVTLEHHQKIVEDLSKQALVLVAEKDCSVDISKSCVQMEDEWRKLLGSFQDKKTKTNFTLKAQMFYSEASEIDAWISEKKQILSSTDYGKDEDTVIKLLTKQKDIELEVDSYKGLVEELAHQADILIESKNPDAKIIKNRMEIIDQEMKYLQNLCLTRRQKLVETKNQREFEKETIELDAWITAQMTQATSEDFGEDYEHVLMLHTNFEFYRARVEAGSKRIIQYEEFSKKLINSKCPFADKVKEGLEYLSARWSELIENLEARAFKLEAAGEIHRYHRDVTDVLGRINAYFRALPSDLGSSLAHAQQLAKKHDATENELLGIEAQLHLLVDDSRRLQEAYPGGNEEHIQMQLALVIENWNILQQKVASRKENLIASQRIHKFLSLIREEENWSKQICFELESDNIPRNLEQIANQHQITESEIEARLSKYEALKNDGESLLVYNLFHKQIEEKLQSLVEIENRVKNSWAKRCDLIDRTKSVILFLNEAKQIQVSFASREVQLCGSETKETVEDLESALKKHLEFQKTMKIQEEKFLSWEQQGKNLLKQNVPESDRIQKKLDDLTSRRNRLMSFSAERSEAYSHSLHLAKFKRDTIEVETWIKEKKNKLRTLLKDYNKLNADEKIKCLQKQQAIKSEIEAHEPIIQRIIQQRKEIPSAGEELMLRSELILENWDEIKGNADRMGRDLKDAQDMLIMHGYFEKAETWIKEKELLIQKNDSGKDYEHCESLQMKLDDNNLGTKIDDSFMQKMRELAGKLSRKENENGAFARYERIYEKYNYLKEEMTLYRRKLNNAAEVHAFIKDVDDTIDRIREKAMFLSAREEIHELNTVEMVRRKLDDIEQDLTVVDKKLSEQSKQGEMLSQKHELSAGRLSDKIKQAKIERQELQEGLQEKKDHMNAVFTSLKFMKDVEDMEKIALDIIKEMEHGEEPSDSADAVSFLQAHHSYKTQIDTCQDKIKTLEEHGKSVLKIPGVLEDEVKNRIGALSLMSNNIQSSWDYRLNLLTKYRDFHTFSEKAKQIETWFASKEAFLTNEDVGDSMSSVEALIRKHENFEKSCTTYFEKMQELEGLMTDLRKYDDCDEIENYYNDIFSRKDRLQEICKSRRKILNDSKSFQEMLLNIYEISNWMNEKMQLASDDSYRDLTNLLSKTKKHATLEAEILANHSRVVSITTQADEMLQDEHFASNEIRQHIQDLEDKWQKLLDVTNEQKIKLNDASNVLKFKQKLEDINSWLDETESQIEFEDYISDVMTIQEETDKLRDIEKDMQEFGDKLRLLSEVSEKLDHSSKEDILRAFYSTEERFHSVEDLLEKKFSKLQEDLSLAGLEQDVNDELSWIEDNVAICQSEEYFDDVISVQILQKKLEALETEMHSREPLINSIVERGTRLDNSNAEIKVKHLEKKFQELKDSISLRRLRLSDALESQTYYFEVAQAEIWMKEKMSQISSCDSGTDLFSVQEMKKKMNAIEAAIAGFKKNIEALEELCSNLVRRGHYDSHNISVKQEELNNRYEQLTCNTLKKIAVLREDEEFFAYYRDVNTVISQLKSITSATNNTDVGRDVEHVESLLQKLELLRSKLCAQEKTVKSLQEKANCLIDGGHRDASKIKELLVSLEDAWLESDYSAETRFKILEQAKLIHSFKKSADETISWIYEKDVALSTENYGHDLQSIETLLRHHESLEGDLKAIQEQVDALHDEATMLSAQFLDYKDTLEEKYNDVIEAYERCCFKAIDRKEKLTQAQQMQSYFDEARDFQAWIREMSAMITQVDLPQDVAACEAVLAQHEGYKSEIDSQIESFRPFEKRGENIISSGHFMAKDIEDKLQSLNSSFENLLSLWKDKKRTNEQNLDLQLFKKKLKELDTWLVGNSYYLVQEDGRSLEEVEYLLQKQEHLEQKLDLYESKFQELMETTMIEEELQRRQVGEEHRKKEEIKLEEQKRIEEIKRKEEERLLEERRKERAETRNNQPEEISDNEYPYHDPSPQKEKYFKPYDSRRSYPNRNQHQISPRPQTPVITRKLTVTTSVAPPTSAEGFLQRKQETLSGGKRSSSRGWKTHYTVLCGQLLCFFKDKKSFVDKNAAKPPINILGARCSIPKDYRKKKYVFRLEPTDNSSYLFEAPNDIKRNEWMTKINYTASLPPSMQLMTASDERSSSFSEQSRYKEIDDVANKERDKWTDSDELDELPVSDDFNRRTYTNNSLYDDIHEDMNAVYNPIYDVSREDNDRSDTLRSYDSARSSLSNPSSYRTALAASSTSTLQDDQSDSSEDGNIHSLPEYLSRTESDISIERQEHKTAKKQMSLPRDVEVRKQESKKKSAPWKVFSLRRKQ